MFRETGEADGGKKNPGGAGRVAVGVLTASAGDEDGLFGVALAVEEPHEDVCAIDLAIDPSVGGLLVLGVLSVFGLEVYSSVVIRTRSFQKVMMTMWSLRFGCVTIFSLTHLDG